MALYDYKCKNSECDTVIEVSHKITESPEIKCEKCGSEMAKLISASSFKLKGEGWYANGYSGKK